MMNAPLERSADVKERPILFNAAMVRAVLDGTKILTRREVRDTGLYAIDAGIHGDAVAARGLANLATQCPHGQPGDRLWVREAWRSAADLDKYSGSQIADLCLDAGYSVPWAPIQYEADGVRRDWQHTGITHEDGPRSRAGIAMPDSCRAGLAASFWKSPACASNGSRTSAKRTHTARASTTSFAPRPSASRRWTWGWRPNAALPTFGT